MKLGLIVNCVGYDEQCVPVSIELLEEIIPKLKILDIELTTKIPNSDWIKTKLTQHTDTLPSMDTIGIRKILKTKNNKGMIVRQCIEELKEENIDFILHIDGSGKFDLKDIIGVIEIMIDHSVDAVLTKRDKSGMNKFRTLIEEFEKEIILNEYPSVKIEDGQSGCWSIRLHDKFKPETELTATGYEIELDILINQLKYKKNIVWLPIKIIDTGISRFKFSANIRKIVWLVNKLSMRKEEILRLADKFKREHEQEIKEAEEESIRLGDVENKFDNYLNSIEKSEDILF